MKTTTKIIFGALLTAFIAVPLVKEKLFAGPKAQNPAKVQICHKEANGNRQEIWVSAKSVASHLAHGDVLGACL